MPTDPDDARTAALVRAYLAACYRCDAGDGWCALAIAATAPSLERAFPAATGFALLSAWNPLSVPQPRAANEAADRRLHAALSEAGVACCRSIASAGDGGWQEPGWLVAGLALPRLDALARRFRQLGALYWRRTEPVRLRVYHARPAGWSGPAPVDWVE